MFAAISALVAVWLVPSRAPATVEEQRARLPPAAECGDDEVTGIWKSHQHRPRYGDWYVFTLDIHRVEGDSSRLTGHISAHSWTGGAEQAEPPACQGFQSEWIVGFDAQGSVDPQGNIFFGGVPPWRVERAICGRAPGPGSYYIDTFSGRIDSALHEFQSLANDGGPSVNVPTVFRRVRCHAPPSQRSPSVVTEAPDMYPDGVRGGCGCHLL